MVHITVERALKRLKGKSGLLIKTHLVAGREERVKEGGGRGERERTNADSTRFIPLSLLQDRTRDFLRFRG